MSAPGVVAALTAADTAADGVRGPPSSARLTEKNAERAEDMANQLLVHEATCRVSDAVAVGIGDRLKSAQNAADRLHIDCADLPAVVLIAHKRWDAAVLLHEDARGNAVFAGISATGERTTWPWIGC